MANSQNGIEGRYPWLAAAKTPGSRGISDADDPNVKMCRMGDTQGPLGAGYDLADPNRPIPLKPPVTKVTILTFNLEAVAHFLRSVALAKAQAYYTKVKWEEYDTATAIKVLYAILWWKGRPGEVVVVQGEPIQVAARADAEVDRLLDAFIAKAAAGPAAAIKFLEIQETVREAELVRVQEIFQDASKINKEVAQEAGQGVKNLAVIKCGADLLLTALAFVPAAGVTLPVAGFVKGATFFQGLGINVLYAASKEWAKGGDAEEVLWGLGHRRHASKEWAKGGDAEAVALASSKEVGKAGGEKAIGAVGEEAADKFVPKGFQKLDRWDAQAKIYQKEDLLAKYQKEIIGKGPAKRARYASRIRHTTQEAEELAKAANPTRRVVAKTLNKAGLAFKIVFAVKDAVDSITELVETWEKTD